MNSLKDYFSTDIQAMTTNDWVGTILTVVIFLLMLGLYVYVLRPKTGALRKTEAYSDGR